jgi:hypothetical protein
MYSETLKDSNVRAAEGNTCLRLRGHHYIFSRFNPAIENINMAAMRSTELVAKLTEFISGY